MHVVHEEGFLRSSLRRFLRSSLIGRYLDGRYYPLWNDQKSRIVLHPSWFDSNSIHHLMKWEFNGIFTEDLISKYFQKKCSLY